jgi:hypothetical protein
MPEADGLARSEGFLCRLVSSITPQLPNVVLGGGLAKSVTGFCRAIRWGLVITLSLGFVLLLIILVNLFPRLGLPLAAAVSALSVATVLLPLYLALAASLPTLVYKNRGSTVEARFLPFAMSLALLLSSGLKISDSFHYMRSKLIRDLPEFNIELDYIDSNISMGRPLAVVLMEAAMLTPSPSLRALLLSLSRAARTGLNASILVEHSVRSYLNTYAILVERASTSLGFLFEVYVVSGLIVPIVIGVTALLAAVAPIPGLSMELLILLSMFVLIPLVSVIVLIIADSIMSKLRI